MQVVNWKIKIKLTIFNKQQNHQKET